MKQINTGQVTAKPKQKRLIKDIAEDIRKNWKNVTPYAKPYLEAMKDLRTIHDSYYEDTAQSIVLYFLSNATSWRGDDARRIKAELKALINEGDN